MRFWSSALVVAFVWGCGPQEVSVGGEEDGFDVSTGKIVGGADADIVASPYQVAVMDSAFHQFCGGSILAPDWVLTANHCVEGLGAASLRVGAGSSRLSAVRSAGQVRSVAAVIRFPGYVMPERGKDVALLRLSTPLDLSGPKARAIPLVTAAEASAGATATGTAAVITGWGTLSSGGSRSPDVLQTATVSVVAASTLQQQYGSGITADQLGAAAAGKDACQGDSGGPLVVLVGGAPRLAGVVSWGSGCADPRHAGLYARVSAFEGWIAQTLGGAAAAPVPAAGVLLDQPELAAARGGWVRFSVTVPAGAPGLTVVTQGGSGDADLYVRYGGAPSTRAFDCRPYTDGNGETCTFSNPQAGQWEIGVRGYAAFSGLFLRATVP